jgi:hypothetical protein
MNKNKILKNAVEKLKNNGIISKEELGICLLALGLQKGDKKNEKQR